jgi:biopolymer transport protein ExbD
MPGRERRDPDENAVDMTPVAAVAFLLLVFFILVGHFKPQTEVTVDTPASTSKQNAPQKNVITITMDNKGRIFFGITGEDTRIAMLQNVAKATHMSFTEKQKKEFSVLKNFGTSLNQLKAFLAMDGTERKAYVKHKTKGIPIDSTNDQLRTWLRAALDVNHKYPIVVKGDKSAKYPRFNRVIQTLKAINENQFQLITSAKSSPKPQPSLNKP